jgi:hypothetical protein
MLSAKLGEQHGMNDQGGPPRPQLPYDELHAAIGSDAAARSELDALRAQLDDPKPDPARLQGHVDALRGVHDAEARIATWWDDPETQRWIMTITNAGL